MIDFLPRNGALLTTLVVDILFVRWHYGRKS